VNPLFVVPLLSYTLAASLWPGQVDGRRRGAAVLFVEAGIVIAALVLGTFLAPLVVPRATGLFWGRVGFLLTGYLYVCGRGMVLVRAVLELPRLQMRRDEDRTAGAIEISRGRAIGALERALALTLVLLGEYTAVGWIIAAKSLARFKALEDREFAEYFLIGTLASLLFAVLAGVGMRILLH
jgi:MFS family permease